MANPENAVSTQTPVLVCAFTGWNDAAEAATDAVEHLLQLGNVTEIASIDDEKYFDYQVTRPQLQAQTTSAPELLWPAVTFYRTQLAQRELYLATGPEPDLRWRSFIRHFFTVAANAGAKQIITLGALLAGVPHSRPFPVSTTSLDKSLQQELGVEPPDYEGPTGIVGALQYTADALAVPAISLWVSLPHYVPDAPNPKAVGALLSQLEGLLDCSLGSTMFQEEATAWEEAVGEAAAEDREIIEYIQHLETTADSLDRPEASGESLAREFQRFLKRRGRNDIDERDN